MKNPLFLKCLLLALIGALLLIPLSMIESTISERTSYRAEAIQAIAANSAGEQKMAGPVLTIPVVEEYDQEQLIDTDGHQQTKTTRFRRTRYVTVLPHTVHFDAQLDVAKRAYGLYEAAVFDLQGVLTGDFILPGASALTDLGKNARLTWGTPTLSLAIAYPRGIAGEPKIVLGDETLPARRGTALQGKEVTRSGFQATAVSLRGDSTATIPFRIDLRLAGTGSFDFIPVGDSTTAQLRSNWPHPSFGGKFLPRNEEVNAQGFSAEWSTTSLAIDNDGGQIDDLSQGYQVRLIEPVDVYRQAMRAVKYGVLFIVLGFAAFFLFENLRTLPIHPIQYLLVGLAKAVFFLLLTSLSEHMAFAVAYAAAASASILLIGIYLAAVLRGWTRGLGFSFGLAILYASLYGILCSEENALLLGSLLLFVALAGLMLGTRRIDWYHLGQPGGSPARTDAEHVK